MARPVQDWGYEVSLIGASGHIRVHVIADGSDEPVIRIEDERLGELVDLPDVATAREVQTLLGEAVRRALVRLPEAERRCRRDDRLTALSDPASVFLELVDEDEGWSRT